MKTLIIVITILLVLPCVAFSFDDGDSQYWNTESASWKISDEWKASLEEELRFGDDSSDFYYQHTDVGVLYSGLADWLDVGISYRRVKEEKNSDWNYENRPHLNGIVKFHIGDVKMSNRSRFEYRIREVSDNYWRYRNKLTAKLPIKFTKLEIQPYVADEFFVNFDSEELDRNRIYSGFSFKLFKWLKAEIYYLWQRSKSSSSGKWSDVNAIGTKFKLSF